MTTEHGRSPPSTFGPAAPAEAGRYRVFVGGAERLTWRVTEVPAPPMVNAPCATCLVFEAQGIARRVWVFPADWWTLGDAELEALSWSR